MTASIETEILINAPRAQVWSVLMDLPRYPEWNPFIVRLSGTPQVGQRLEAVIQPFGRKAQTFTPTVTVFEDQRCLHWRGSLPVPGLFTGTHMFDLSDAPGGTLLKHSETFSGLLVPVLGGLLKNSEQGFNAMNAALKARVEGAKSN